MLLTFILVKCIRVLQRNRNRNKYIYILLHKYITIDYYYYEESAHIIIEVEKSHDLPYTTLQHGDTGKPVV